MIALFGEANSRDFQTHVFHLTEKDSQRDLLVSFLDPGLPQFPVGGGRSFETGHLGTKDGFAELRECMCR
jgi:hypothetical protein